MKETVIRICENAIIGNRENGVHEQVIKKTQSFDLVYTAGHSQQIISTGRTKLDDDSIVNIQLVFIANLN